MVYLRAVCRPRRTGLAWQSWVTVSGASFACRGHCLTTCFVENTQIRCFSLVILRFFENMFFEKYFEILKIGHFVNVHFSKSWRTFVFLLFRKHEFSICYHNAHKQETVISCYAVEEFGRKNATREQISYKYLPK